MKGDFTRLTFDPNRHYRGVLMQQGRAQLDSDWNEQVQIAEHRYSTFFGDFVGQSGAPATGGMKLQQGSNYALKLDAQTFIRVDQLPDSHSATIELWFRADTPSQNLRCILALGGKGFGVEGGYPCIKLAPSELWRKNDQISRIDNGIWHYLAWVIKQTEYTGAMQHKAYTYEETIYVDGQVVGGVMKSVRGPNLPGGGIGAITIPPALETIEVGAWGGPGQRSDYFGGKVAELRLWNSAKTIGTPPTEAVSGNESGLIRYYPLTEADYATSAKDHSRSKIDAAIHGDVIRCDGPFPTGTIRLSSGRYYVDGLLVERNEEQPLPDLTKGDGLYLAYLDVWTSHITVAEDGNLREPALGGPDTTTRIKTESRLRCEPIEEDLEQARMRYHPSWPKADEAKYEWEHTLSIGTLSVNTSSVKTTDNRLFRLEIHDSGPAGQATFKWSRDNGAVIARVSQIKGNQIILERPDLATTEAFRGAQHVEVTDEDRMERGEPGVMIGLQHTFVENDSLYAENNLPAFSKGIRVRRWDSEVIKIKSGNIKLGSDMTVSFGSTQAFYRSGDYWLIPVRAGIILDWVGGSPQPPHGIEHHFAVLALIMKQGDQLALVDNLQTRFQPLTSGNVSKMGDTINGDLSVRGRLSVGSDIFRAPLSITASNGALMSFADENGTESWRIRHQNASSSQPPALHITDTEGKGLTIQQGNVGIGKMDPGTKLAVYDDDEDDKGVKISVDCPNNREAGFILKSGGDNKWEIYRPRNYSDLRFWESGIGDRVTFQAGGNVGIGTANPQAALQIERGDATSVQNIILYNPKHDWGAETLIKAYSDADNANVPATAFGFYRGLNSDAGSGFIVKTGTRDSLTTKFIVNQAGNVGIGTAEPSEKLVIQSNITSEEVGLLFRTQDRPGSTSQFYDAIRLKAGWHGTSSFEWGEQRLSIQGIDKDTTGNTFWNEIMTIKANGNVGIGSPAPKGALHIKAKENDHLPLIIETNQTFDAPGNIRAKRNAVYQVLKDMDHGTICVGGVSNDYLLLYFKSHDGKIWESQLKQTLQIVENNP